MWMKGVLFDSVLNSGLSNFTVVIPTISRPQFVLRQFEYWRISDAQVVILDGAKHPIDIPEHLKAPNIRYVCTGMRFNERLATVGASISTAYCALLPDDEFFLFSGLHAAIAQLEANRDLIGCVGRCLGFFVDQGRFLTRDVYRDWKPFSEHATTQLGRLHEDLPPHKSHKAQFAILRTNAWRSMFENSYRQYFSCGYTYERLLNLQRSILGRTELLDDLLWMRSFENLPISNDSVPRFGNNNFLSWARSSEFAEEVEQYRAIALGLLIAGGVARQDAIEFEERFFVGGIKRQANKELTNSKKFSTRVRNIALNYTPKALRRFAKRYVPNRALAFSGWQGFELDEICRSLEERGTQFDREDLELVKKLSLKLYIAAHGKSNSNT